jgi:hypothetical protein
MKVTVLYNLPLAFREITKVGTYSSDGKKEKCVQTFRWETTQKVAVQSTEENVY